MGFRRMGIDVTAPKLTEATSRVTAATSQLYPESGVPSGRAICLVIVHARVRSVAWPLNGFANYAFFLDDVGLFAR